MIASAKHGDKLDIVQVRRRFVRVRTPDGQKGWTDSRNLLSSSQMEDLQELARRTAKLPSQGEATVYGALNMHVEPSRTSTSFYQINEGVRVDILRHEVVERTAAPSKATTLDLNKPAPPRPRRKRKEPEYPPPPPPARSGSAVELGRVVENSPPGAAS